MQDQQKVFNAKQEEITHVIDIWKLDDLVFL